MCTSYNHISAAHASHAHLISPYHYMHVAKYPDADTSWPSQMPTRDSTSPVRLVSVTKEHKGDARSWLVQLTSDDCSHPTAAFALELDVSGELKQADVAQVQSHSEQIRGSVVASIGNSNVIFSPYATAEEVRSKFEALGSLGNVKVTRTGKCNSGFGWVISFIDAAGDIPLMSAKLSEEDGAANNNSTQLDSVQNLGSSGCTDSNPCSMCQGDCDTDSDCLPGLFCFQRHGLSAPNTPGCPAAGHLENSDYCCEHDPPGAVVQVFPYIDGGHLMGPISADYMHEPVTSGHIQVLVNKGSASCERDSENVSLCRFAFNDSLTPTVTHLASEKNGTGLYSVTILGDGLSPPSELPADAVPRVTLASLYDCAVSGASDTEITCQFSFPFVAAGQHAVEVVIPGRGAARGSVIFTYELQIERITPLSLNRNVVNILTIHGAGFSPDMSANTLMVDGTRCEPIKVSARELECKLGADASSGRRRRHLLSTLDLQISLANGVNTTTSALSSISGSVPTCLSVTPEQGAVGGGFEVTISGTGFSASISENTVLLAGSLCTVTNASGTLLKCIAGAGSIGLGTVTVIVDKFGSSDPSGAPQFEYELSVTRVNAMESIGFGGALQITLSGTGFLFGPSRSKHATPLIAIAGRQTFTVGVYTPVVRHEVHRLLLTAQFVSEVQRLSFTDDSAFFMLLLFGRHTQRLPKTINRLDLQTAISKLMPTSSPSVSVVQLEAGWQVQFSTELGDVQLLEGRTCTTVEGECSSMGIAIAELIKGVAPFGNFSLIAGNGKRVTLPIASITNRDLSSYHDYQNVNVEKRRPKSGQIQWDITLLDLTGICPLPDIDASRIIGGNLTIQRLQEGLPLPDGQFQLQLGEKLTEDLPLNATGPQIQLAIIKAFPDVISTTVYTVDHAPGRLLDRVYPRQWVVKMERHGVAGKSIQRCTDPGFVDWDPTACPSVASNLFLHHYPWYWPGGLPRPTDLGQDDIKAELQGSCDAEARALQLRPGYCEAPVPLESLPVCGEGSGINPPCWTERFTSAKVRHADGQDVIYTRDDSRSPSDTTKGFRFWARADLKTLTERQLLTVKHSVAFPSGVDATEVYRKAEQTVECETSFANATSLVAHVPSLLSSALTVAEEVQSDYLLNPLLHISFSREDPMLSASNLLVQSGVDFASLNGEVAHLEASAKLAVTNKEINSPRFTVEMWVMVRNASGAAALLQNVGDDDYSGFALVLSSTEEWQFYLAAGSSALQEGSIEHPVAGFSVITAPCAPSNVWSHVAIAFDGAVQSLYLEGKLKSSSQVLSPYRSKSVGSLVLAGPCMKWLGPSGCRGMVQFVLDEALVYDFAVPAMALAAHAALLNLTMHAQLKVKSNNVFSSCTDAFCDLQIKTSSMARVLKVEPPSGFDGTTVTIRGAGFSMAPVDSVSLGSVSSCSSIAVLSDAELTCTARGQSSKSGPVTVVLQGLGASFSMASFEWISVIHSIAPSAGSLLGGTRITMIGSGIPNDLVKLSVSFGTHVCAIQSSSDGIVECVLGEIPWPFNTTSHVLPLTLKVHGKAALCSVAAGCAITTSLASTPALRSLHAVPASTKTSISVTEGSKLVFGGVSLPTDGAVTVSVGDTLCATSTQNETHVVCVLARGVGGHHRVRVLFAAGYAADFLSHCCTMITYQVLVASLSLSTGVLTGGQLVTISGIGFDAQTSSAVKSSSRVFVGQRKAPVRSAHYNQVIFEMPSLADELVIGLEREHIWQRIRHCGLPESTGEECVGQKLCFCAETYSWGAISPLETFKHEHSTHAAMTMRRNDRILVLPGSDVQSLPSSLVDGDSETIWLSQPGVHTVKLVFDLGESNAISRILINWAGASTAAQVRVEAGSGDPATCSAGTPFTEEVVALRTTWSAQWQGLGTRTVDSWEIKGVPTFSVNWIAANGDLLFHFQPRLSEEQVVMNAMFEDAWGSEERFDFPSGSAEVTWTIAVDNRGFHVLGSGQHLYTFVHRGIWSLFSHVETTDAAVTRSRVDLANQMETIALGNISFSPRVLMVELRGLRDNLASFGIRDVVFVKQETLSSASGQPVLVEIGGVAAFCGSGTPNRCNVLYSSAPAILRIHPTNGTAGTQIKVDVRGLDLANCSKNKVSLSNSHCMIQSCGGSENEGWILCAVSSMSGGEHRVSLTVGGVRASDSGVLFNYVVSIAGISPALAGYGGGYAITLRGDGFPEEASRVVAKLCQVPCRVISTNTSTMVCVPDALVDSRSQPGTRSLVIAISEPNNDATEDVKSKAIVLSSGVLSPSLQPDRDEWSTSVVYLRFSSVDIAQGMRVARARLQVRAADNSCAKGSQIRLWTEATDHSQPFDASDRGSLGLRKLSSAYEDWIMTEQWRFFAEAQESSDLSDVINEVIQRPGWRAGNSMTLILRQRTKKSNNGMTTTSCNMMSADYSLKHAPKLRLELANVSMYRDLDDKLSCPVMVSVKPASNIVMPSKCETAAVKLTVSASVSDVPRQPSQQEDIGLGNDEPNLYRRVLYKKGPRLTYEAARIACAGIGMRLCRKDKELLVQGQPFSGSDLQPFFGMQTPLDPAFEVMVPYQHLRHNQDPESSHYNNWMQVSGDSYSTSWYPEWEWRLDEASVAENQARTGVVPCCGVTGNPAYMAVDDEIDTYWDSGYTAAANLTVTLSNVDTLSIGDIEIMWTQDYAREYRIWASIDGESWFQVAENVNGDGALDYLPIGHGRCRGISAACLCDTGWPRSSCNHSSTTLETLRNIQLRIEMLRPAPGSARYGITEIFVKGCRDHRPSANASVPGLFTADLDLTPEVAFVVPNRGTTAGGSEVTVTGRFFSTEQSKISVSLGPFACAVQSVIEVSAEQQEIVCVSSASGILHGGLKYVRVDVDGLGASVASDVTTFWYVDTWGARTTWGGKAPPTGCGSWVDDKDCTDTVYIPEGQIVLLDMSLPRFYLILIEGTLIFDRKDIQISASYILLRGGTLQIGTEEEPFMQNVLITLYGHPKSVDLPTFGAKVVACFECTMDIHGAPQVAWTQLAATVLPGASEIMLQDAVTWPVDSKIVIATTDFESPRSSHSEVATVARVFDNGKRVQLKDIRVCPEYGFSGLPEKCTQSDNITFPHLGEIAVFDGKSIPFRAEVSLLSRNIVIQGDHDDSLCPLADTADDGVTRLSCNQFGGQMFFHSPGLSFSVLCFLYVICLHIAHVIHISHTHAHTHTHTHTPHTHTHTRISAHAYKYLFVNFAYEKRHLCSSRRPQHATGHESLVVRLSNFEIRNAGQAFRLGRYAIHWHMVGNLRESFQRNVSVHHSWNRSGERFCL